MVTRSKNTRLALTSERPAIFLGTSPLRLGAGLLGVSLPALIVAHSDCVQEERDETARLHFAT